MPPQPRPASRPATQSTAAATSFRSRAAASQHPSWVSWCSPSRAGVATASPSHPGPHASVASLQAVNDAAPDAGTLAEPSSFVAKRLVSRVSCPGPLPVFTSESVRVALPPRAIAKAVCGALGMVQGPDSPRCRRRITLMVRGLGRGQNAGRHTRAAPPAVAARGPTDTRPGSS
ncbi:hypothetical protein [Ornithinimicrobium kibberense]|uniref:hypothetical protein n=1 Tax=Ornithinimicrobium kibberense TaxID=282060 RepID=UPI0036118720